MANWTQLPGDTDSGGRRRQTKYRAHTLVTSLPKRVTHKVTRTTHTGKITIAIGVIRLICSTKRPGNHHLIVRSSQTPGNLLDSFYIIVAKVIVHSGDKRSTVVVFPRRGLVGSQGTDRHDRYNCNPPTWSRVFVLNSIFINLICH
jgi:hypothetical protein